MMADERAEPLTGAELSEILGRLDQSRQFLASGINDDVASGFKLASAMSDLARLLATLEAVRPLVVAMAGYEWQVYPDGWDNVGVSCPWCGTTPEPYDHRANDRLQHDADCPVTQARELKERLGW